MKSRLHITRAFLLACSLVSVGALAAVGGASAATSSTVVGATVPGATSLDATGCGPNISNVTNLGSVLAPSLTVGNSCAVTFGSSNTTAQLRLAQTDGRGAAMYQAPYGAFDPTFDTDGVATATTTALGDQSVVDAAILPDDGMLLLSTGDDGSAVIKPMITRVTAAGAIDTSFGTLGTVWLTGVNQTNFMTPPRMLRAPSGDLIVAGVADGNAQELWIRRLRADGSTDTSFGTAGTVTFDIDLYAAVSAIRIDAAGRIVVAGRSWKAGPQTMLVRVSSAGVPDPGFGTGGITWFNCGDYLHWISGLVLAPDGRIFTVGEYQSGASRPAYVASNLSNGAPDPAFGTGGCLTVPGAAGPSSMEADSQGRLVIGLSDAVARLVPSVAGTWDPAFGTGGVTTLTPAIGGLRASVQSDDSIIAFGSSYFMRSARLRPDGSRDMAYGSSGVSMVPGSADSSAPVVVTASDGRTVSLYAFGTSSPRQLGMARLATTIVTDFTTGQTWSTGGAAGMFGACLRNATLGAATGAGTWVSKGGTACTTVDADPWNAIKASPSDPAALVARTTVSMVEGARVDLQFGFRTSSTQRPGAYVAPITFDVIAP